MRENAPYDVVAEFDYPLGESSDLAYDTWGRHIREKVKFSFLDLGRHRVLRQGNHLKISVRVDGLEHVPDAVRNLLRSVASQAPEDVVIKVHECEPVPVPAASIEEIL